MNKTVGPAGKLLFDYASEVPVLAESHSPEDAQSKAVSQVLKSARTQPDVSDLEGASDDPTFTKVVDRRWYERNKHIYPASVWQDFDPDRDYQKEVRRDLGGNTFFYS